MAYLTRDEAEHLTQRILSYSRADQARVFVGGRDQGNARFAQNQLSTAGDVSQLSIRVLSAFGSRIAYATTNRTDDESLRRVVETSEALARLAPEDPEYMDELGPQQHPTPNAVFQGTVALSPDARARAVEAVTETALRRGLVSSGFATHSVDGYAVATSNGLFGYHALTRASFSTTVRTSDGAGSGWAGVEANDWADIDAANLGVRASDKAEASRGAREVELGRWTVILEPTAVANMLGLMMSALSARAADEGRSFFSRPGGGNRIGERFVDGRVNIVSDPMEPLLSVSPFDGAGVPAARTTWVEDGALRNLIYDRYWAERNGRAPTGIGGGLGYSMEGGSATLDDMIRSTPRGLLVTRLWYIRSVDPRTILFTGLTRDSTFLIEDGRIAYPVKNLRWNESPIFMLNNIEMMGRTERVSAVETGGVGPAVMVPALKVRDFTFTSLSDAV
jgi:predicted Zn-dependent protease